MLIPHWTNVSQKCVHHTLDILTKIAYSKSHFRIMKYAPLEEWENMQFSNLYGLFFGQQLKKSQVHHLPPECSVF